MKLKTKNKDVYIITGVAGLIGSTLLSVLIKRKKCIIIGIDNYKLGKFKFIKNFTKDKKFVFFKTNLNEKIKNNKILKILKKNKLKQIWHLASNSDIQSSVNNPFADLKNTFFSSSHVSMSTFIPLFCNRIEVSIVVFEGPPKLGSKVGIILKIFIFFL